MRLDDVGWMLLVALQRDGRASYRELGEEVGLTPPAVADRIRRMEAAGLITGYRAEVSLEAVGLPIIAMVRATPKPRTSHDELEALARRLPQVREAHRVTGSEHMWLKISARSLGHLDEVLQQMWGVADTTTNVVLSPLVEHRPIDPMAIDDATSI